MDQDLAQQWPSLRTLTDLALRHWNVRVTCAECARERVVHGAAAWWLFHRRGWPDDVRQAAMRFRCVNCGKSGGAPSTTLSKTREAPSDDALPLPDEREWKRLVSRYRS